MPKVIKKVLFLRKIKVEFIGTKDYNQNICLTKIYNYV